MGFSTALLYAKEGAMTIQDLGAIGELIGSIGVILTLIYLAVQIRQNTATMEESQRLSKVDAMLRRNEQMERTMVQGALSEEISQIVVQARADGVDSLTAVEHWRLYQWECARAIRAEAQYFQWENGYLDNEYFETQFKQVVLVGAPVWRQLGITYGRPSFRAAVEKIIDESGT